MRGSWQSTIGRARRAAMWKNTKVTTSFEFVTLCAAVMENRSMWAKGDLNPHVPKDTGT